MDAAVGDVQDAVEIITHSFAPKTDVTIARAVVILRGFTSYGVMQRS